MKIHIMTSSKMKIYIMTIGLMILSFGTILIIDKKEAERSCRSKAKMYGSDFVNFSYYKGYCFIIIEDKLIDIKY